MTKSNALKRKWTNKLEKLERILSFWKSLNLTLFGKYTIINTISLFKISYNAQTLENPNENLFQKIKSIYNFIWKKQDRLKRNMPIGKIEQ